MSFLSVTYYYCLNILLSLPLVIICIYFYFSVLFWYVSVNFNTNTISITVFSVGVLFCPHSNVYYVSIVHCNGYIYIFRFRSYLVTDIGRIMDAKGGCMNFCEAYWTWLAKALFKETPRDCTVVIKGVGARYECP